MFLKLAFGQVSEKKIRLRLYMNTDLYNKEMWNSCKLYLCSFDYIIFHFVLLISTLTFIWVGSIFCLFFFNSFESYLITSTLWYNRPFNNNKILNLLCNYNFHSFVWIRKHVNRSILNYTCTITSNLIIIKQTDYIVAIYIWCLNVLLSEA
jgi:hypothetical protein